jgi:hypothetical protein
VGAAGYREGEVNKAIDIRSDTTVKPAALLAAALFTAVHAPAALAQTDAPAETKQPLSAGDLAKQKQDPLSGLRQVVFQAVVNPDTPAQGKTQANYSLQAVWPFSINEDWKLITYSILPVIHQPTRATAGPSRWAAGSARCSTSASKQ